MFVSTTVSRLISLENETLQAVHKFKHMWASTCLFALILLTLSNLLRVEQEAFTNLTLSSDVILLS